MSVPNSCGCHVDQPDSEPRRKVIKIAVASMAVPWVLTGGLAHGQVTRGDRLVDEDAEGTPAPLKVSDLRIGKPMVAYPFDTKKSLARNDSRLNKIVLLRLPEGDLDPKTRARAAGGVIAYSAICTHTGCDVKTWLAKEKALICFCHSSKFSLLEDGIVASGPAPRSLPSIPLSLDGDQLVIAGPFSAAPGASG